MTMSGTASINCGLSAAHTGANYTGSGVYIVGGSFTMNGGTIRGCVSQFRGGGVSVQSTLPVDDKTPGSIGTFTMTGGTITDNLGSPTYTGYGGGGGVALVRTTETEIVKFYMQGGTISGNTASSNANGYGGGVYADPGTSFTMSAGQIINNLAASTTGSDTSNQAYGGGVYLADSSGSSSGATFKMTGGTISDNTAGNNVYGGAGGGVAVNSYCTFTMSGDAEISRNRANTFTGDITSGYYVTGGGVYITGNQATFTMSAGKITGNTASASSTGKGGGILIAKSSSATLSGTAEVSGNSTGPSGNGGGIYVEANSTLTIDSKSVTITENKASTGDGGGIYTEANGYNDQSLSPRPTPYSNIEMNAAASFSGNKASTACTPPTSLVASGVDKTGFGTLLNNNDINSNAGGYQVTYKVNGGTGADVTQACLATRQVISPSDANFTSAQSFLGWNTKQVNGDVSTTYAPGETLGTGGRPGLTLNTPLTLYAQWGTLPQLTVTNSVTGPFSDKTLSFDYSVTLQDFAKNPVTGPIAYTRTSGSGQSSNSLTLDDLGVGKFKLSDGESVTFTDLPWNGTATVTQTNAKNYAPKSDPKADSSSDSVRTVVTVSLTQNQIVTFTNGRDVPVPTGIWLGGYEAIMLPILVGLFVVAGFAISSIIKRQFPALICLAQVV